MSNTSSTRFHVISFRFVKTVHITRIFLKFEPDFQNLSIFLLFWYLMIVVILFQYRNNFLSVLTEIIITKLFIYAVIIISVVCVYCYFIFCRRASDIQCIAMRVFCLIIFWPLWYLVPSCPLWVLCRLVVPRLFLIGGRSCIQEVQVSTYVNTPFLASGMV
jgi:hypothetical protein